MKPKLGAMIEGSECLPAATPAPVNPSKGGAANTATPVPTPIAPALAIFCMGGGRLATASRAARTP